MAGNHGERHTVATMPPTANPDDTLRAETPVPQRGLPERCIEQATSRESRLTLWMQLPADPVTPSVARHRVRRWLTGLSWPAGQRDDIVLAVSEAVSNAAEHAYLHRPPGMIDVHGGVETTPGGQRRVTIIVRDHGHWRPAPADDENRRRGIPLMRACMDIVTIEQPDDRAGSRVVLRSSAVPPPTR
jgi:serine/threonine-protein kinase RsbW